MNLKYLFYLPAIALCTLIAACAKESPTIVNGVVVDNFTGAPIDSAFIQINITHKPSADGSPNTEIQGVYTNKDGKFSFESNLPIRIYRVGKIGYIIKGQVVIVNGAPNDLVIKMIPNDGVLSLKVENLAGIQDTIFLAVYSPILKSEISISGGYVPLSNSFLDLTLGNSFSQDIPLASNQEVNIYWDFIPINHSTANKGNASIMKNDTVFYTISY